MGNVTEYTKQSYIICIAFDEEDSETDKSTDPTEGVSNTTIQKKPKIKSKKIVSANLQSH